MTAIEIQDGIVNPNDPGATQWGFTTNNFTGDSYLWKTGRQIMVSLIMARFPGRGDFARLVRLIEEDGFTVAIPTPLGQMQAILTRWGFVPGYDDDVQFGNVEVWRRP